nr:Hnm1 [Starmerella bombicola]
MRTKHHDAEISSSEILVDEDAELFAELGYTKEIKQTYGLVSMIGFTFSILTCWTALGGSLAEVMLNGGPAALVYGWIGCCFFTVFVVLVMAELCSAYPVAGGQYSWCLILGQGTKWGRLVSYICGWFQLSGLIGMLATGLYLFGLQVNAVISLNIPSFTPSRWVEALIGYGGALVSLIIGVFGQRFLHYLADIALWWQIFGFIACTVALLACAPKFESPLFVFTTLVNKGWSNKGMAVILGVMQSAYGMCTYDSVAHLAEETENARKESPKAMVISVFIGFVTGLGFVLALLFCIQDLDAVINTSTNYPLLEIFNQALSGPVKASGLNTIILGCQVFANVSLLTASSRSLYAFARDGAFPLQVNKWLTCVSPSLNIPLYSMITSELIGCALVAILFGSSTAFFTVLSIASTGLYVSYLMPIVVYTVRPSTKARGYYNLGSWAIWCQIPAIFFLTFCIIFFFFPTEVPVTGGNMNYDVVALGVVGILAGLSWFFGAETSYKQTSSFIDAQPFPTEIDDTQEKTFLDQDMI